MRYSGRTSHYMLRFFLSIRYFLLYLGAKFICHDHLEQFSPLLHKHKQSPNSQCQNLHKAKINDVKACLLCHKMFSSLGN